MPRQLPGCLGRLYELHRGGVADISVRRGEPPGSRARTGPKLPVPSQSLCPSSTGRSPRALRKSRSHHVSKRFHLFFRDDGAAARSERRSPNLRDFSSGWGHRGVAGTGPTPAKSQPTPTEDGSPAVRDGQARSTEKSASGRIFCFGRSSKGPSPHGRREYHTRREPGQLPAGRAHRALRARLLYRRGDPLGGTPRWGRSGSFVARRRLDASSEHLHQGTSCRLCTRASPRSLPSSPWSLADRAPT
jgi:hypothetical protein